ncbi:archaellin/type IV pilin N-terminal domain-containing protein [Natrinema sp. CGMCC1.2065]|uniref:archaellin/type IV pilin N-terminal domain-containing protein n=1 Tax=Natrinema sp. CGMCC1.2065 TaxID=3445767 RepID=UPI003F4A3CC9
MTTGGRPGVSPVVSTVLMVAVVIVLAAAIGTSFLGFGDLLGGGARAAVETEVAPGTDDGSVTGVVLDIGSSDRVEITAETGGDDITDGTTTNSAIERTVTESGERLTVEEGPTGDTTIEFTGVAYTSRSESIVLEREITI